MECSKRQNFKKCETTGGNDTYESKLIKILKPKMKCK